MIKLETLSSDVQTLAQHFLSMLSTKSPTNQVTATSVFQLRADKHMLAGSNFHRLEYDAQGTCFRWTGASSHVAFCVPLSREFRWRAVLRFIATMDERSITETRLLVDGRQTALLGYGETGMWSLESEQFDVTSPDCELTFIIAGTRCPHDTDASSPERRSLGIAWHDLRLFPA